MQGSEPGALDALTVIREHSSKSSEITMATQPQSIMGNVGPGIPLASMFRDCSRDPTVAIEKRLRGMLQVFVQHYRNDLESQKSMTIELAVNCSKRTVVLYYGALESIVKAEKKRLGVGDVSSILEHELFQQTLVVCCLEIILFLEDLPGRFPLLLQIFNMPPYNFSKVIGLVLREYSPASNVVTHLSKVAQQILESWAWTRDSPLWRSIEDSRDPLPTCQQVNSNSRLKITDQTPDQDSSHEDRVMGDLSAVCFNLPTRQLPVKEESGSTGKGLCLNGDCRPQRTSYMHLFLRNVYDLMHWRLTDLCSRLDISHDLQVKIWTCFEHSLIHFTHLMLDRHLDQLLMCAIYIIPKTVEVELPFKQIIECYKTLPHISSSVCTDVLISGGDVENSLAGTSSLDRAGDHSAVYLTPVSPAMHHQGSGTGSRATSDQEQRGHLIAFYNRVYTKHLNHFTLQFSPTSRMETPLSTMPPQRKVLRRRYRLSQNQNVLISNYSPKPVTCTPACSYYFRSSSSKCLQETTNMVKTGTLPRRRHHAEEESDGPLLKRRHTEGPSVFQQRLRDVMIDRAQSRHKDVGHRSDAS